MNDEQPEAADLLALARETLLEKVLPELSGEARYQALMIASAMAMAEREISADPAQLANEAQMLLGLYEHDDAAVNQDPEQIMQRLRTQFARELRRGEFDGGLQFAVRKLLRHQLERQLAVSKPRVLGSAAK